MEDAILDLTIVVPVGRRYEAVPALLEEYAEVVAETGHSFEFVVVLDGPHKGLGKELSQLAASRDWLRFVELAREFGESAALSVGFSEARGRSILTLPGYRQVEPAEIAKVISAGKQVDMAIAVRWPRSGSLAQRIRRSGFHGLLRLLTGQRYRDLGCGVRLLRREIAEEIPLYSDRHHFYPALAHSRGFEVSEVEVAQANGDNLRVPHNARQYLHRFLDILTLFFLVRFTKKPLRFFGTIGFIAAAIGFVFLMVLVIERLFFDVGLADRPALLLSSLLLVLGVQIFALGLIGELIIFTHARELKEYAVRRVIGAEHSEAEVQWDDKESVESRSGNSALDR